MSRKTDEDIRNYIADFEASGKTIDCWCRENKISRSTFYHWRHSRIQYKTQNTTSNAVHFLEVKPATDDEATMNININDLKNIILSPGINQKLKRKKVWKKS